MRELLIAYVRSITFAILAAVTLGACRGEPALSAGDDPAAMAILPMQIDGAHASIEAQRVAADLAPLAIAAGWELEVAVFGAVGRVRADASAVERVLTNLVQNAIEHGGRHVTIRVRSTEFEVEDNGPAASPLVESRWQLVGFAGMTYSF